MLHHDIDPPAMETDFADYTRVSTEYPTQSLKNHIGKEASVMRTIFRGRTLRSMEFKELGPKHRGWRDPRGHRHIVLFLLRYPCQ